MKEQKKVSKKITSTMFPIEKVGELYQEGKITKDEWSRMTPALRKMCKRYTKKKGN